MRLAVARICIAVSILVAFAASSARGAVKDFVYLSPLPGSRDVSPGNNVAIRPGDPVDPSSVSPGLIRVVASRSGTHAGTLRLATDGLTLVFRPDEPYALHETVHVRLGAGLRTRSGRSLPGLDYVFQVSPVDSRTLPRLPLERDPGAPEAGAWWREPAVPAAANVLPCDTLLAGFPTISLVNASAQLPGVYFVAPFSTGNQSVARLEVIDDRGKPLFERQFANNSLPVDFKVQPDGRLTFWMNGSYKFYAMDSAYAIVDSITCGNGYPTDLHELKFLPDGHMLIMSYDPQPVSMDTVVAGGNPNAIVYGLVVQELDQNKDVVFQWRSWDHFKITDASVAADVNLQSASIDYVHGNSIEKTLDGNLIISCRHMNELTKIDRQTGDVIWRMGLNAVNNQFTFPNDTRGFSHTHDARILPNGNLTVYDNGNFLNPQYSRALEFQLDEQNKIATKVWEYRHTPDVYGGFMGNVERHADGSTTIGWGGTFNSLLKSTDLHADGTLAAELQFPATEVNYRSFRRPWRTNRFLTNPTEMDVVSPTVGSSAGKTLQVWNHWDRPISITCLRTADTDFGALLATGSLPVTLAPGETTTVLVTYTPSDTLPMSSRLYVMQVSDDELVAQSVILHGHIDPNVGVEDGPGGAFAALARPNPLRSRTTIDYSVPSTGRVSLELFDLSGRRVARLVDGVRTAGRHSVEWTATRGRGGLYFCRLQAAGRTLVQKLVVAGP